MALLTPQIISDQVTGTTVTPVEMIHTTDRDTTETTIEMGDTNTTQDVIRETNTTKSGVMTIKIKTGSTTGGDRTNTNTIEINPKHKSSSNSQIRM